VQSYDTKARRIAADQIRQTASKLLSAYLTLGVDRKRIEDWLGCPVEKATTDQLADLRGIYTALENRDTTVAEAFPEAAEPPQAASVDDVLAGGAEVTQGTETGGPERPQEAQAESPDPSPENAENAQEASEAPAQEPKSGKSRRKSAKAEENGLSPVLMDELPADWGEGEESENENGEQGSLV